METHRHAGTCYAYCSRAYLAALQVAYPDMTAAFYDGRFHKTLEQAQSDKHRTKKEGKNETITTASV